MVYGVSKVDWGIGGATCSASEQLVGVGDMLRQHFWGHWVSSIGLLQLGL